MYENLAQRPLNLVYLRSKRALISFNISYKGIYIWIYHNGKFNIKKEKKYLKGLSKQFKVSEFGWFFPWKTYVHKYPPPSYLGNYKYALEFFDNSVPDLKIFLALNFKDRK